MNRKIMFVLLSCVFLIIGAGIFTAYDYIKSSNREKDNGTHTPIFSLGYVLINEVCAKNSIYLNDNGRSPDLVELYNSGSEVAYLTDWYLTDTLEADHGSRINDVVLGPGERLVVFCGSDESDFYPRDINMPFDISAKGETIYLIDQNGAIADFIKTPQLEKNVSYSRVSDGSSVWRRTDMTIGLKNGETPVEVSAPVFSAAGGFYDEAFYLELSGNDGCEIFYTLDGSEPSDSSIRYDGPIYIDNNSDSENVNLIKAGSTSTKPVKKAVVVRAAAIDAGGNKSETITKSFFIGYDGYAPFEDMPIISLVIDPSYLFDEETGIFTNYMIRGLERRADIEYYDENRSCLTEKTIGVRVRGNSTRGGVYKSLTVFAREGYDGDGYFTCPIIDGVEKMSSFILRYRSPLYSDGFLQSLVSDRDISIQGYRPVLLFINGELWKTYAVMEKYSGDYIEEHYGVEAENTVIVKDSSISEGNKADILLYYDMISFIKDTDFSIEENYLALSDLIDIQSFADLYAVQIYISNVDFYYAKNVLLWRARTPDGSAYGDGRWRWMLYDLDAAMTANWGDITQFYDFNTFTQKFPFVGGIFEDPLFNSLMANEGFRELFSNTFKEIAENNFNAERVLSELNTQYGITEGRIVSYFSNRYDYAIEYLNDYIENWQSYYPVKQTNTQPPLQNPVIQAWSGLKTLIKENRSHFVLLFVFFTALFIVILIDIARYRKRKRAYGDNNREGAGHGWG